MEARSKFEPLSHHIRLSFPDIPARWLPMIHLYDPDTPFFPVTYFHIVPEGAAVKNSVGPSERAYGYIERIDSKAEGLEATVHCNKDLTSPKNSKFLEMVSGEVRERLGASNPVTRDELATAFSAPLDNLDQFLVALWDRTVPPSMGTSLPFGRYYDHVFGLIRMVATWFSEGGRKGEMIMTHYFMSKFGQKIGVSADAPSVGFYLFPTLEELRNPGNPLEDFPMFGSLCEAVREFHEEFCEDVGVGPFTFSSYRSNGRLDTPKLLRRIRGMPRSFYTPLIECFNAYGKGPQRTVLFLLMLNDLRFGRLRIEQMKSIDFWSLYTGLGGTYQSPKVLNLYAQQGFGNPSPLPIDTWIDSFLVWPFGIHGPWDGTGKARKLTRPLFQSSQILGKVERLLWFAAQARKVHSPICDDALWCLKLSSTYSSRGANPLACSACVLRSSCPAFAKIGVELVAFNGRKRGSLFQIKTSAENNATKNQRFTLCKGGDAYDDFTPVDTPHSFRPFPQAGHRGKAIPVREFVELYGVQETF